jgi:hypothetical protein
MDLLSEKAVEAILTLIAAGGRPGSVVIPAGWFVGGPPCPVRNAARRSKQRRCDRKMKDIMVLFDTMNPPLPHPLRASGQRPHETPNFERLRSTPCALPTAMWAHALHSGAASCTRKAQFLHRRLGPSSPSSTHAPAAFRGRRLYAHHIRPPALLGGRRRDIPPALRLVGDRTRAGG